MGPEFIHRVIKTSLVVAVLGFLFVTVYYDFKFGAGILVGTIWGCLNLYFLTNLITEIFSPDKEVRKGKVILIVLVKFPLLYLVGYVLLIIKYFPAVSLVSGFTLIFVVMFLKALGRWVLSLETSKKSEIKSTNKVKKKTVNG
ncbi:hypothetical protein AMJ44_12045 [candidate division WOR-1 bacterium DG_54_3]|uniref:ATP synthase I n=1 Tax=candidate division WOR-1 bacterium DG_54_3 TaxID=1703775 RepID=A0A0S7XRG9_UNCSA|nr:MAG: hypothetical protein AMJ44_12045 [candidate division WOR-1 bacterium DG_54_3]